MPGYLCPSQPRTLVIKLLGLFSWLNKALKKNTRDPVMPKLPISPKPELYIIVNLAIFLLTVTLTMFCHFRSFLKFLRSWRRAKIVLHGRNSPLGTRHYSSDLCLWLFSLISIWTLEWEWALTTWMKKSQGTNSWCELLKKNISFWAQLSGSSAEKCLHQSISHHHQWWEMDLSATWNLIQFETGVDERTV